MVNTHALILCACSGIAFIGHYLQFGILRITPWIPASIGLLLFFLRRRTKKIYHTYLTIILIIAFAVLTTAMCIEFLPQAHQPIRKKIIFTVLSLSGWVTTVVELMRIRLYKR